MIIIIITTTITLSPSCLCFYDEPIRKVGMNKSHWRKSANWFGLTRKHAYVFVNETKLEPGWDGVTCCDEHYLPSILAYYGLDNETTCTDGLAHVNW